MLHLQGSVFFALVENIINLQLLGWILETNHWKFNFATWHLPNSAADLSSIVFRIPPSCSKSGPFAPYCFLCNFCGPLRPPLSLVWISSHSSFGLLLIFVRPPLSFLAASFELLLLSFEPLLNLLWASFGSLVSLLWFSFKSSLGFLCIACEPPLSLLCISFEPSLCFVAASFKRPFF